MKKRVILSTVLAILSVVFVLSHGSLAYAEDINIKAWVTIKNTPKEVLVGQTGKLDATIDNVQGVPVTGKIKYNSGNPEIFSINDNGEWKAHIPGKTSFSLVVTLSKESLKKLKEKYPNAKFYETEVLQQSEVTVTNVNQSVFRLYNPNSGEHFYTLNKFERDNLSKLGWNYEGLGWQVPKKGIPVFRLYNRNSGEHFYTLNTFERDKLKKIGWNYEGIGWYTNSKGVPVYRLYNKNDRGPGAHHYTINQNERISLQKLGWNYEGVAWYGN